MLNRVILLKIFRNERHDKESAHKSMELITIILDDQDGHNESTIIKSLLSIFFILLPPLSHFACSHEAGMRKVDFIEE